MCVDFESAGNGFKTLSHSHERFKFWALFIIRLVRTLGNRVEFLKISRLSFNSSMYSKLQSWDLQHSVTIIVRDFSLFLRL